MKSKLLFFHDNTQQITTPDGGCSARRKKLNK